MTTINDWRLLLERRLSSFRRRVEIPLELRLVSITATVVIALVAAGAQVANVIGAQQRQATTHTTIPDSWQPDGVCYAAATAPRMISFQELAQAQAPGVREIRPGVYHSCTLRGLTIPEPMVGAPSSRGQVILVSLSQQWLWAYRDGALVFANPVATGRDYLRTPLGVYQIDYKRAHVTFYSPWPRSSPFYYSPEHINYALNFRAGGFYIHDAPWRQMFGPGAQDPHTTPTEPGKPAVTAASICRPARQTGYIIGHTLALRSTSSNRAAGVHLPISTSIEEQGGFTGNGKSYHTAINLS